MSRYAEAVRLYEETLAVQKADHLVGTDRNIVLAPDLGEQQAEPDPPLGDAAVFGAQRFLVLAAVFLVQLAGLPIGFQALPDLVEFSLHQRLG